MQRQERVLVIGDDMRIFLAVVRSLGRAGKDVHAAPFNWRAPALRSRYVAQVHRLPRYSDDPAMWLRQLLEILERFDFDLIVPCCDRAILPLQLHRGELSKWRIAAPDPDAMDALFDKEQTRALCDMLAIPVAPGATLGAADTAEDLAARYGLPLVLKPKRSYSMQKLDTWGKVWIVDTVDELRRLIGEIADRPAYLVEGYFEGVGVGVSVLARNGKIAQAFQHRRLRQGRGGSSSYRISERLNPDLHAACEKICRHVGLNGVCMFEFRWNPDTHRWILLETNARFWGSVPLPVSVGVDFPRFLYEMMVHGRTQPQIFYPSGVRSRNLVLDGFNLLSELRALRTGTVRPTLASLGDFLAQPIRLATGRERSDSFVADDMMPGIWECGTLLKAGIQKLVRARHPALKRRRAEQVVEAA